MMTEAPRNLLDLLRRFSSVDCDTLNVEVAQRLGPFVDCISNQAIVHDELTKLDSAGTLTHYRVILDCVYYARSSANAYLDATVPEEAVEAIMVKLAQQMAPHLTGFSHLQTSPNYSSNTQMTINNAKRLIRIWKDLDPSLDPGRVCIKIPATWEGIEACKELEKGGVTSLATAVGSIQQATLASAVGCTYIGCYVNDLEARPDMSVWNENQALRFPNLAQSIFRKTGSRTQVISASLNSIDEAMILAGVHHITVSPLVLWELARTPSDSWKGKVGSLASYVHEEAQSVRQAIQEERSWRASFARDQDGKNEERLYQAITFFSEKQKALEDVVRQNL